MSILTQEVRTPDSPASLYAFNRETLIDEATAIHEKTGAGIVPLVDKVARLKDWQNKSKKTPQSIRDSLSNTWVNGAGVLLPEGFCVVDTDTEEAERWAKESLPATFTVKTRKGYHRYYSTQGPIRQSRSGIQPGVDVLAVKNYAVYVGSVHPDTGLVEYQHTNPSAPIEALPDWLYERLKPESRTPRIIIPQPGNAPPREPANAEPLAAPLNAVENAREVIPRLKPNTLANLNDTSDGRDKRVYSVICSLLQSGCGDVDDVMAVLVQYPLWSKVAEQEDPMGYLTHKVESAQQFIEERPAEVTVLYWRRRVSGANVKSALMKVLHAIGFMAFRLTKQTGNEATRLTLSKRSVALGAGMTASTALRKLQEAEQAGWIKRVSNPGKGSGYAPAYLLTFPRSGSIADVVSIDVGHDAFRHGVLASALPVYQELHRGSGKADELAKRIGATPNTTRRNLNKLKDAEMTEKVAMVWKLTEDHELKLDLYAQRMGSLGKRQAQKEKDERDRALWKAHREGREQA